MSEFDYQLWQHSTSGEKFAVKLRPYVPAEERGMTAGSLADQQYEAGLILGASGPFYCGSNHQPMTAEGLKQIDYSTENLGWFRQHSAKFFRIEFLPTGPMGETACILCGLQHEPAEEQIEVQLTVAQILDLVREHRDGALKSADHMKQHYPDDPDLARAWTGRAQALRELLESIPGTPEALELFKQEVEHEEDQHRQIAEAEQAGWDD